MTQINVVIAGRTYRMACADGEEDHLRGLATRLDGKITELRGSFGEIGDSRITVMAAITMTDDLAEAERRIATLEAEVDGLRGERAGHDAKTAALAETLADALGDAATRIDRIAQGLNAAARE